MIPAAAPILLEAALRALVTAAVLWTGLRLMRVRNVPAQKTAWGLVLAVALAMPLLMRIPLPAWAQLRLPVLPWPYAALSSQPAPAITPMIQAAAPLPVRNFAPSAPKPDAAHYDASTEFAPRRAFPSSLSAAEARPSPAVPVSEPASEFDPPLRLAVEKARAVAAVSPAPTRLSMLHSALSGIELLWSLYLVIAAALLFRLLLGLASSMRLWLRAQPVEVPGHSPAIPIRASARIASPGNIGSGIVLPADFREWDEEKLRVVLAHESCHVRQRDFYLQLLAGLYAALLWFSPLGWWLKRKLSELGEAISDRAALEAAASPSAYAQMLLEFAVLPRSPIPNPGVAMAHAHHLSTRIERLLNDAAFRQSFAGRRRALAALLLVPIALLVSTALVRVQAAESHRASVLFRAVPQSSSDLAGQSQGQSQDQSHPDQSQVPNSDSGQEAMPQAAPAPSPAAPPSSDAAPAPPAPGEDSRPIVISVPPLPQVAPLPPMPVVTPMDLSSMGDEVMKLNFSGLDDRVIKLSKLGGAMNGLMFLDAGDMDCDAAALVGDPGSTPRFFGAWDSGDVDYAGEIDKARKQAHGHFLWFHRDGKSYILDDAAIVSQLESMQSRVDDLRKQMRDLREQERGLGEQEREQARKQREAAQNLPKPDLSDAVAQLNAAVAALKSSQGDTISREQLAEIQRRLGEIQSKLVAAEVKVNWNAYSSDWSKWSQAMSDYGSKMGALGSQIGQAAKENHEKIRSIIDESLKNGKAQLVN
jgi:beta-lactamase regulating signal transducer with metallopeptidase domain